MGNCAGDERECVFCAEDRQPPTRLHRTPSFAQDSNGHSAHFVLRQHCCLQDVYDCGNRPFDRGAFGSAQNIRHKETGVLRAVKTIKKSSELDSASVEQEILVATTLDHPCIVQLYEVFEDKETFYMVMERCNGGNLRMRVSIVGPLPEAPAAIVVRQLLEAVRYMHHHGICNRDLKPEAMLFTADGQVTEKSIIKIADFGMSCRFRPGDKLRHEVGTLRCMAPDMFDFTYDSQVDLWSCGVCLYFALSIRWPFSGCGDEAGDETAYKERIKLARVSFKDDIFNNISSDAKDLIRGLLKHDANERLTADSALDHAWVQTNAPRLAIDVAKQRHVVQSLHEFRAQGDLKKAALRIIAGNCVDAQVCRGVGDLRETFLDIDKDGHCSRNLGPNVDYRDFVASNIDNKLYLQEDKCRQAFSVMDLDGDGKITLEELGKVLRSIGVEEVALHVMEEVDTDGDGAIDFQEFMAMMRSGANPDMRPIDASEEPGHWMDPSTWTNPFTPRGEPERVAACAMTPRGERA